MASIHPYRVDAADAVSEVVKRGALALKWLLMAMRIDPASPLCNRFYDAVAKHDLPLDTHGGEEKAVEGAAAGARQRIEIAAFIRARCAGSSGALRTSGAEY